MGEAAWSFIKGRRNTSGKNLKGSPKKRHTGNTSTASADSSGRTVDGDLSGRSDTDGRGKLTRPGFGSGRLLTDRFSFDFSPLAQVVRAY